jgi:hypothetical protein
MAEELPLVRSRSVETSGQTPGYLNVDYSPEAFGAGIGRALSKLGGTIDQIRAAQEEQKANDALQHVTKAKDELRPILFHPETGVYATQGGQAQNAGNFTRTALDNIKASRLKAITDPKTREVFEKLWAREEEQVQDTVANHELKELGRYKTETTKGVLLGAMQDAYNQYNDPKSVQAAIDLTTQAITANTIGSPPEIVAAAKSEAVSGIHLAVVNRLASEDPAAALAYVEAHRDALSGQDHVTANKLIQPMLDERRADQWIAERTVPQAIESIWPALQNTESGGNTDAVSPDGALGLSQLMLPTAREQLGKMGRADIANLSDEELTAKLKADPTLNVRIGKRYLGEMYTRFGGDMEAALVAYNAGPDDAEAFLKHNAGKGPGSRDYNIPGREYLTKETQPYVNKILGQARTGIVPGTRITRENWALKNFQPSDLLGNTPGTGWVDAIAATTLDGLAGEFQAEFPGLKIKVNEEHTFDPSIGTIGKRRSTRTADDNPGAKSSKHLQGQAFDIQVQGWNDVQKARFIALARSKGFGGIGFYGPEGHLHIDMGRERSWGRVPAWAKDVIKTPVSRTAAQPGTQVPTGFAGTPGQDQNVFSSTLGPGRSTPAIATLLAEANEIVDPTERSRVMSKLETQFNIQDAAAKQEAANLKRMAWETTLSGGFDKIPPEILARLGREEVNGLREYDKESKKAGGIQTNFERYSQLKLLSEEELVNIDPYDFRHELADTEFKELVNVVKAARDSRAGDSNAKALMSNMRSRADILKSAASEMGWDLKRPADEKLFARLDRKVDDFISMEQQAKNRALSPIEIQDIVDKLLITDTGAALGIGSRLLSNRVQAMNVEDPDTFTAANTWDMVTPDDQVTLQTQYESAWGKPPDQEQALDLYNRAMRVYLGGTPEGPDEELDLMRQALQARFNRIPSDNEVRQAYGRYLLQLLGR